MDKYKELFNLALEAYHEQNNRYNIIFDKATKYISVLTLLIGLYSYLGKIVLDGLIENHSKNVIDWLLVIIEFVLLILLLISWSYLFRVLRLAVLEVIPMNDEVIKWYGENRLIDIYYAMSKGIKDAIEKNEKIIKNKSDLLTYAYVYLRNYTILFIFFSLIYLISKWNKLFCN